ncbi:MAG TPA: diguanylate cyclase [Pseudidiomarina sp.]|nr:diguanylate cyclase [Pseudidiomarina sp.]
MRIAELVETKRTYWSGLTLGIFLYCAGMVFVVEELSRSIIDDAERVERDAVEDQAETIKARLELFIFSDIYTANSIATLLTVDPDFVLERFDELAANAVSRGHFIRNIGLAPDNVIQRVYPLKSNEKALGLDFKQYPEQLRTIELARQQQSVFLAGPLELVQGGLGIVARFPIFSDFPENQEYWGTVSVVKNVEPLLQSSELIEFSREHRIALRGVDGRGENGDVFWGNPDIFTNPDFTQRIDLPSGSWQMAVQIGSDLTVNWWQRQSITRAIGYAIGLFILLLIATLVRSFRLARFASYNDALTGLPNRRFAVRQLHRTLNNLAAGKQFAVMLMDLNGFKAVNDLHGHEAGDELLRGVALTMRAALNDDIILTRLGGDEYLVIVPDTTDKKAGLIAKSLVDTIEHYYLNYHGTELHVGLSIGLALCPRDATTVSDLLKAADERMYANKKRRKQSK